MVLVLIDSVLLEVKERGLYGMKPMGRASRNALSSLDLKA